MDPVYILRTFLVILVSAQCMSAWGQKKKIIACFFTNWSQYRQGIGKFVPENVDPTLCTHLIFAFAKISSTFNTIQPIEWNYNTLLHPGILKLKEKNPKLKLILSVGGYNALLSAWTSASQPSKVVQFSQNVVTYVRRNQFDGVDIDWETPSASTSDSYFRLMKALREVIHREPLAGDQERLLLTTDVKANRNKLPYYKPGQLTSVVDYVILMAYDFYGFWSHRLGHHSPLFLSESEPPGSFFSQHQGIEMWREAGVGLDKLVLGVATYGRSLAMSSVDLHQPGDSFTGHAASMAPYTTSTGIYAYYEVCSQKKVSGWTEEFMQESRVPYTYGPRGNELAWIGYDNPTSIKEKAVYVVSRGLAGIMIWTLDFDDFLGTVCGQGHSYPLLRSINQVFDNTPTCSTNKDCEVRQKKGVCVSGFCGCPGGDFVSTKPFCTDGVAPPNSTPGDGSYGNRPESALTSLWVSSAVSVTIIILTVI